MAAARAGGGADGFATDEIEWALEEFGECESAGYIAIEPD